MKDQRGTLKSVSVRPTRTHSKTPAKNVTVMQLDFVGAALPLDKLQALIGYDVNVSIEEIQAKMGEGPT